MDDRTQVVTAPPLGVGHELLWFRIDDILGQGGFGMTYLATDTNLGRQVAIKEYLPGSFAFRAGDFTVKPLSGDHEDNYSWGLDSFQNEARTLARFKHRNIVQVHTVFEEHNTAYMVMEYEQGDSLSQIFRSRIDQLDQQFFEDTLFPVIDGLQQIHDAGYIHRDIKPGNLIVRSDGSPVLIDFGSARQTSIQETGEMTTLVSQGYTPLEQYSSNFGGQGPWTDIYAFAASVYHGITHKRPIDALGRSASLLAAKSDPFVSLSSLAPHGYDQQFIAAIDAGLMLNPGDRPQTLADWRSLFELQASAQTVLRAPPSPMPPSDDATRFHPTPVQRDSLPVRPEQDRRSPTPAPSGRHDMPERRKPTGKSKLPMALGAVFLAVCAAGGWWYLQGSADKSFSLTSAMVSSLPKPAEPAVIQTPVQRIGNEIQDLQSLGAVYIDALKADANSPEVREGLDYVVNSYASLVESPLVSGSEQLRQQAAAAIRNLSSNNVDGASSILQTIEQAAGKKTTFGELQPLLKKKTLNAGEREALLFGLASLDGTDLRSASTDKGVADLVTSFKQAIFEATEQSNFDKAAITLELALLAAPTDEGLLLLKKHLETAD